MIPFDLSYSEWVLAVIATSTAMIFCALSVRFKILGDDPMHMISMVASIVIAIAAILCFVNVVYGYESQETITICDHYEMNGYNYIVDENWNTYAVYEPEVLVKLRDNTTQHVTIVHDAFGPTVITKTDYIQPNCCGEKEGN